MNISQFILLTATPIASPTTGYVAQAVAPSDKETVITGMELRPRKFNGATLTWGFCLTLPDRGIHLFGTDYSSTGIVYAHAMPNPINFKSVGMKEFTLRPHENIEAYFYAGNGSGTVELSILLSGYQHG